MLVLIGNSKFIGGAEIHILELYKKSKNKYETFLITDQSLDENTVKNFNIFDKPRFIWINLLLFTSTLFVTLIKSRKKNEIVIHSHYGSIALIPIFILKYFFNFKWINTFHGEIDPTNRFIINIYFFIISSMDCIICVNKNIANKIIQDFHYINPIYVIPTGVDLQKFNILNEKNYNNSIIKCTWIGGLRSGKNLDLLVNIFLNVQIQQKNIILDIYGKGVAEQHIKEFINKHKILNIKLNQQLNHDIIPSIINQHDVGIITSDIEGLSTVMLEYLACGRPVISTAVSDIDKVLINGYNGYIINSKDPKEFIYYIEKCCEINSINCRRSVQKYSWDNISKEIFSIYNRLFSQS